MTTINLFTPEQRARIAQINSDFEEKINENNQGHIQNEDAFEKKGLFAHLQETADFRQEYAARAVEKIGRRVGC